MLMTTKANVRAQSELMVSFSSVVRVQCNASRARLVGV